MADYKKTLNLPKTSYPMKADLVHKEPETLKFWEKNNIYDSMLSASGSKGTYLLHDGPPYANGNIHLGTALNKIIKDIIVKSKNLAGYKCEFVPGWDCHGLPIERNVEKELGEKKQLMPTASIRKACRKYAQKYLDIQRKEFKRLGVFGIWDKPYMSMDPAYEAVTAGELANFVDSGNLNRSKKPIYWCNSCQTALAEAEVEYADHSSPSVYVRFKIDDPKLDQVFPEIKNLNNVYFIIWTTTPWTLPNNLGISVHPDFVYSLIGVGDAKYIIAKDLVESCAKEFAWDSYIEFASVNGSVFDKMIATHPFYSRNSLVMLGTHVTLEAGTGCVHTAPGHGREDYEVGLKYGLEAYSPLDDAGRFLPAVEFFNGMNVFDANPHVIAKLKEVGNLVGEAKISHSYPHCWRCHEPIIFRATTQWFITMDGNNLRQKALNAIQNDVNWIPAWGRDRIYNMIEQRPDWCISRQRTWGVPILALLCKDCGEAWQDSEWMRNIAKSFAAHPTGCDKWYEADDSEIIPKDLKCKHCGSENWKRETDILDVWFDSGTSFAAVMEQRPECGFPADLYLEGSDQHRGWFHSSLLVSIGTRNRPPYLNVLTHGYVVDGKGHKMSKSVGNVVVPDEIISQHGAELLRLWVSSIDYREDIRYSNEIMNRLVDAYRRIRNTIRYILGSLDGFTPDKIVAKEDMESLDLYALDALLKTHQKIQNAYENFEFYKMYHTLHGFCTTELSAFYFDILKDRLYSSHPNSKQRYSAQTALYYILLTILRDMAPVLSFTAEESLKYLPKEFDRPSTVFALPEIDLTSYLLDEQKSSDWEKVLLIRSEITKAIEPIRQSGEIGHSLDTKVKLYLNEEYQQALTNCNCDFRSVCIISQLEVSGFDNIPENVKNNLFVSETEGIAIFISKAEGEKCERCWIYSTELGTNENYPTLCPRCTKVMQELENLE